MFLIHINHILTTFWGTIFFPLFQAANSGSCLAPLQLRRSQDVQAFSDFLFYVLGSHVPSSERHLFDGRHEEKTAMLFRRFYCGTEHAKFAAL